MYCEISLCNKNISAVVLNTLILSKKKSRYVTIPIVMGSPSQTSGQIRSLYIARPWCGVCGGSQSAEKIWRRCCHSRRHIERNEIFGAKQTATHPTFKVPLKNRVFSTPVLIIHV